MKRERILNKLLNALDERTDQNTKLIKIAQKKKNTNLANIRTELTKKYTELQTTSTPNLPDSSNQLTNNLTVSETKIDCFVLKRLQHNKLLIKSKEKTLHGKLAAATENKEIDLSESSKWLTKGNIFPGEEAGYSWLQDRNMFHLTKAECKLCSRKARTI